MKAHQSGVYEIVNTVNGKRYIGSATKFQKRWVLHRWELRRGSHGNIKLQRAWGKYGSASFQFNILLICHPEDAVMYEQIALDVLDPEYNICKQARSSLGVKRRPETREKISVAKRGKPLPSKSAEERTAISLRKKGVPLCPDAAEKAAAQCCLMAAANIGRVHSDAAKARMAAAQRGNKKSLGHKHTPERNAAISASLAGRKRGAFSLEWRQKLGNAHRGQPKSAETKAKMSEAAKKRGRRADGTYAPRKNDEHA